MDTFEWTTTNTYKGDATAFSANDASMANDRKDAAAWMANDAKNAAAWILNDTMDAAKDAATSITNDAPTSIANDARAPTALQHLSRTLLHELG